MTDENLLFHLPGERPRIVPPYAGMGLRSRDVHGHTSPRFGCLLAGKKNQVKTLWQPGTRYTARGTARAHPARLYSLYVRKIGARQWWRMSPSACPKRAAITYWQTALLRFAVGGRFEASLRVCDGTVTGVDDINLIRKRVTFVTTLNA